MANGFQAVPGGRVNIAGLQDEAGRLPGLGRGLSNPLLKSAGTGVFATWLLNKILSTKHEAGMRDIQLENLRSQAELLTPQNLYYQAALPQAQEEESMARSAMLSHLSGGVLGPSLAKGEFRIGG
jgi:hypothetical protein